MAELQPGSFRKRPAADLSDVVQLVFRKTPNQDSLYAYRVVLKQWSGVLAKAMEVGSPEKLSGLTIPLDDEDVTAWVEALRLIGPSVPLFQVTWDNWGRLALLADKYDMPCITEHVKSFLSEQAPDGASRLQQQLTADNAFCWLNISSRVGLTGITQRCIEFIVNQHLETPKGFLQEIRLDVLQQLDDERHKQAVADQALISQLQQQLETSEAMAKRYSQVCMDLSQAARPLDDRTCSSCYQQLFRKPNGKMSKGGGYICIHCGKLN